MIEHDIIDRVFSLKNKVLVQGTDTFPYFEVIYFPGDVRAIEMVINGVSSAIL